MICSRWRLLLGTLVPVVVGLGSVPLYAAPYTLSNTEVHALPVSANGRNYTLYVGLPSSYASAPDRRYPVVYVTDGYWNFALVQVEAGNLAIDRVAPECIVVGIAYSGVNPNVGSLRQYDLTYPAYGANTGGGRDFLGLIAGQFIPYVESHFRVDSSFRVLGGASAGGLFAVYALFEQPELFQAYVAVSPGDLRYANGAVFAQERDYARTHTRLPVRLFLSYATDEVYATIRPATRDFYAQVKASHYADAAITLREITGEGHSGTGAEAFNRGLRYAFVPRAPVVFAGVDPGFSIRSTFVNVSTRARVGGGDNVLIGGFVVQGVEPKRVLVRAAGPALAGYGVSDYLRNPRLRVVRLRGADAGTNDDWSDAPDASAIASAAVRVGAFPFAAGSRDAAMLVTLEPGPYTVVVDSVDGSEGIALVEAYELPGE